MTHLHAHQQNYYSNLHVTLYFVKSNNSIPFFKEQSCQANLTHLHAHQQNYYSNLHVTLYSVKSNNSIPFFKEQPCQANKLLIIVAINSTSLQVEHVYILVQNLIFSLHIS